MLIGWIGIITGIIVLIIGVGFGILNIKDGEKRVGTICIVIGILLSISISIGSGYWLYGTESGKRAQKDWISETSGGIERVVTVYNINGQGIQTYEGKFDIETNEQNYILFEDENGERHTIYYTTGTIIVDEK